jgi:hypothetical protein
MAEDEWLSVTVGNSRVVNFFGPGHRTQLPR